MKNTRKILAVVLSALMLVCALSFTVFADDCTHENMIEVKCALPEGGEYFAANSNVKAYCPDCDKVGTDPVDSGMLYWMDSTNYILKEEGCEHEWQLLEYSEEALPGKYTLTRDFGYTFYICKNCEHVYQYMEFETGSHAYGRSTAIEESNFLRAPKTETPADPGSNNQPADPGSNNQPADNGEKVSVWQKIVEFFNKIIEWIKGLFNKG